MLCHQLNSKAKMKTGSMRLMPVCCSSNKRSLVGSVMLREKGMLPWKQSQKGQVSGSMSSEMSSRHSSVSSSGSRSSKSDKALNEKLRMAELLSEVHFPEELQAAEFKGTAVEG